MHRRSKECRIPVIVALLVSLVFLGTGSVALAVGYQPVNIKIDDAERVINTGARSPLSVIQQAGLKINPRDRIRDQVNSDNVREIVVSRAHPKVVDNQGVPELQWEYKDSQKSVPVVIYADNKVYKDSSSDSSSARSLVQNAGVSLSRLDRVKVKETATKKEIYVQRVTRSYENTTEVVTAPVKKIEDKDLEKGKEKVESEGVDGLLQTVLFTETVDGKTVTGGKKIEKTLVTAEAKVVKVGTKSSSSSDSQASVPSVTAPVGESQEIAHRLVLARGWSEQEFSCLVQLWKRESGWRTNAANPSGAYGIPQALPGSKMAAYGSDWRTNPETQIKWGLSYVSGRYGTPCKAWAFFGSHNWY